MPLVGIALFAPKIFDKNGLDAFRLVGSDGSEFFYEGAVDCDEKEIYKDAEGRLYYPVKVGVGSGVQYFVELEAKVPPLPAAGEARVEKEISRLVNVSPRTPPVLPANVFVRPKASEEVPPGTTPEPQVSEPAPPVEEAPKAASPVSGEAAVPGSPPPEKPEAPVAADAPPIRRQHAWPIAIVVAVVIIIAVAAGAYIVKPEAFQGLSSLYAGPTPAPTVAPTATPVPTPEPTEVPPPAPTPEPGSSDSMLQIATLIDSGSPDVQAFAAGHIGEGGPLRQVYSVFTYVNGRWNYTENLTGAPRKASEITRDLRGDARDYSVLMSAVAQSLGVASRIIVAFDHDTLRYYPEVLASNTTSGYDSAMYNLQVWYGVTSPFGHSDDDGYWISLSMGSKPGRPVASTEEYAVYPSGPPEKIK